MHGGCCSRRPTERTVTLCQSAGVCMPMSVQAARWMSALTRAAVYGNMRISTSCTSLCAGREALTDCADSPSAPFALESFVALGSAAGLPPCRREEGA